LDTAAWCDLVTLALNGDGNATCLLADPLATGQPFRDLLAWSLTGHTSGRYQPYATTDSSADHVND
jgi:hypothetical protein